MAKKTKISGPETEALEMMEQSLENLAAEAADLANDEKLLNAPRCKRCDQPHADEMSEYCPDCIEAETGHVVGIVPLDQQMPDEVPAGEIEAEPELAKLIYDTDQPWAGWSAPDVMQTTANLITVGLDDENEIHVVGESGDLLGRGTPTSMKQLGWLAGYPAEFVGKLSPQLQVAVVNERLAELPERQVALVFEDGEFSNLVRGSRGIAPYRDVAQTAFDALRNVYDEAPYVHSVYRDSGSMQLNLMTQIQEKITAKRGDILQMGVQINQDYGLGLDLSLNIQRLVCTNGMTANRREFSWRIKDEQSVEHQLAWLTTGIGEVVSQFQNIVTRSRQMSEMPINGEPHTVLEQYARAMGYPTRYLGRLFDAYEEEPDPTQWGILNAFTRVGTHALSGAAQRNILAAAGSWVDTFDYVNCRLPRPVATSLGAELIAT